MKSKQVSLRSMAADVITHTLTQHGPMTAYRLRKQTGLACSTRGLLELVEAGVLKADGELFAVVDPETRACEG